MPEPVVMPRLSDSMEEGTVLKWLVEEGGEVKRGEPLVEIETDKANMTYEADTDGVLVKVIAKEGDTLPVGEPIAEIGEAGEEPSGDSEEAGAGGEEAGAGGEEAGAGGSADGGEASGEGAGADEDAESQAEREQEGAATATAAADNGSREENAGPAKGSGADGSGADGGERIKASPVARRMAAELGVELARLEGSGPGGRIVKADVESAAEDGAAAPETGAQAAPAEGDEAPPAKKETSGAKGEVEVQDLTRLQQTVTRRMAESKATAPDFALTLDVDMTAAVELRGRLKEVADPVPSFNDMVVKAAAGALREFPKVNGAYRDGRFELYEKVNVGIAVAAEGTLVVPTIFGADGRSLGDIARSARALIEKVREGNITPPEVSGGTFTISNLGMFGIERFTAIINPPQAALLTVGALERKPAVDDRDRVVARDQLTLTLVCDHRILYGADGAQFLARVRELLEQPLALAL
ncbi:MAG: 2-oxo acid dehydrogenase subunit E2 [Actinomycetota bacterium]|nr:2-oxo acid dehydrogenase subunit E2 [Actinomycetota bacterium]